MNLLKPRYSIVEGACLVGFAIALSRGDWFNAAIIVAIWLLLSILIDRNSMKRQIEEQDAKDKVWQDFARQDRLVDAIKEHRRIYGSGLKEAKDIVCDWRDRNR